MPRIQLFVVIIMDLGCGCRGRDLEIQRFRDYYLVNYIVAAATVVGAAVVVTVVGGVATSQGP